MEAKKKLLTVKEVSVFLRLDTLTIYKYILKGDLPAIRFGRYYRIEQSALDQFIIEHEVKTTDEREEEKHE